MSTLSEKARSEAKSKAERLVRADPTQRVDASGYRPDGAMNADVITGSRPISRRQFRRGGKVSGEAAPPRADRKPRAAGGALTANSLINRDVKEANKERGGLTHTGGMKSGGKVHADAAEDRKLIRKEMHKAGCDCSKCMGGRVGRKAGGAINDGTRPVAGRLARKGGGRAKGKTNINIVIAPQGGAQGGPAMPPPGASPGGPVGLHQGVPPQVAAPGPAALPQQQAPMMRKDGGRAGFSGKLVNPGSYPIETGGGGGLARLEKAQRAKRVNP